MGPLRKLKTSIFEIAVGSCLGLIMFGTAFFVAAWMFAILFGLTLAELAKP